MTKVGSSIIAKTLDMAAAQSARQKQLAEKIEQVEAEVLHALDDTQADDATTHRRPAVYKGGCY